LAPSSLRRLYMRFGIRYTKPKIIYTSELKKGAALIAHR
jgi:hypothetical protein